jgi:ADP-ribose pyrophosphatase YjhB (NUDIX family)
MMVDVAYLSGLPRKRVGCGALIVVGGELLIVKPAYKEGWGIPGGVVDAGESPHAACVRECREELGIEVVVGRLLLVDWASEPAAGAGDALHFLFAGKVSSVTLLDQIRLPKEELSDWRLASVEDVSGLLTPDLSRRVGVALRQGGGFSENGLRRKIDD